MLASNFLMLITETCKIMNEIRIYSILYCILLICLLKKNAL